MRPGYLITSIKALYKEFLTQMSKLKTRNFDVYILFFSFDHLCLRLLSLLSSLEYWSRCQRGISFELVSVCVFDLAAFLHHCGEIGEKQLSDLVLEEIPLHYWVFSAFSGGLGHTVCGWQARALERCILFTVLFLTTVARRHKDAIYLVGDIEKAYMRHNST